MPRIAPLLRSAADPKTGATLDAVKAQLGTVPNLFSTLAHSPSALNAYLGLSETLSKGVLTARQREIIALAVGQANACQYCVSAHTALGKKAGLTEEETRSARSGRSEDKLEGAIAALAVQIVQHRGNVTDGELAAAASAGVSEAMTLEIVAHVAMHILSNYANNLAHTEVDFPRVAI
jgi:uncharacterized peroxidase-related enzyme